MFKKVVVADSLAPIVDKIFAGYHDFGAATLWLGVIYFAFQIYCDFSGYSDIAIGTSKLFGFELMSNFKFPYFSRNIGEFWRRWHISLSTWFRDYVYIPLGGSKEGKWKSIRNIFIIFIISGFWHGANWTFIFWGFFHSILFLPSFIFNTNRIYITNNIGENKVLPTIKEFLQISATFLSVTIGWVFFRSETIKDSFDYLNRLFEINFDLLYYNKLVLIFFLIVIEWKTKNDEREIYNNLNLRRVIDFILLFLIISYFGNNKPFIYFNF